MEFLRRHKKWFIVGLMAAALILMAFTGRQGYEQGFLRSSVGSGIGSAQVLFANIGNWFSDRFEFLRNMNTMHVENQRLRAENERLQADLDRFLHLNEQIRILAEIVDLHLHYDEYNVLAADIIARDPGNWSASFTINRGSSSGLAENMAVLAPGGLVGRVARVGFNYSVITPLLEDGTSVAAQSERAGEFGVVSGDINLSSHGLLRMSYIEQGADLSPGDAVITSSLSAIFPPGIRIGHIAEMGQAAGGLRYALVVPAVDFGELTMVLIITDTFEFILE
ncbi:MAG: rod shape-determining protein MreC [Clostridiales bacterium]|nr:rod shape-determining protein MreC [Clostridiales bacterium]